MTNSELNSNVAEYIFNVTHSVECWDDDNYRAFVKPCPFATFDDAIAAYRLHMKRVESRNYVTLDEKWQERYRSALASKGLRVRRLRPRRGMHCQSHVVVYDKKGSYLL